MNCWTGQEKRTSLVIWLVLIQIPSALAASNWVDERTVGPFTYHADFPLGQHQQLWNEMQDLHCDLAEILNLGPLREPIHFFVFDKKSTYQAYMKRYFPQVPRKRAIFIKGRGSGNVFVYHNREFDIDVRHEGTHALLHACLPLVPLWLDEGLAEYFEVSKEKRLYGNGHLTKTKIEARFNRHINISLLEQIDKLSDMGETQYRHAWAAVHFMLHYSPETRQILVTFFANLAAQQPPGRLSQHYKMLLPNPSDSISKHFRDWQRPPP